MANTLKFSVYLSLQTVNVNYVLVGLKATIRKYAKLLGDFCKLYKVSFTDIVVSVCCWQGKAR